jgi:hypothetical protein
VASRSTIKFKYDGIGSLLRSNGMADKMVARAKRIQELAESRAPVYSGTGRDPHRGRYKSSFRIESYVSGGYKKDRAAAVLVNDAPEAVFVEFGARAHDVTYRGKDGRTRTVKVPAMEARHILGSSMMAAGYDE